MSSGFANSLRNFQRNFRQTVVGPQLLAFLPAITLGGYWLGGEGVLLFLALLFPAAFAITGMYSGTGPAWSTARDKDTDLQLRAAAEKQASDILAAEASTGKTTTVAVLELDEFHVLERRNGAKWARSLLRQTGERLGHALRETDLVARLEGPRFAVVLGPVRQADLGTMIQLSSRLQAVIAEPFSIDASRVFATASLGFCLPSRVPKRTGTSMLECAEIALDIAISNGHGSVRAFKSVNESHKKISVNIQKNVAEALENGQILPWFQPQVSTNTGEISGFEALARWTHPERGIIAPAEFLPVLEEMGMMERLSEIILSQSLSAFKKWKSTGVGIPNISVNFSRDELSNPKICARVKWELDRYDLEPGNLCVEILEDVIAASQDDVIIQNIQELAKMGCQIDLDDFGTGHASIANIRRFAVNRIKIDRSFIVRVDRDREQQNMVAAILTMAERLEIETLAEGVETIGEHTILAQLGCGHVQGFSVARPMPFEETAKWVRQHRAKLPAEPKVGHRNGS